MNKINTKNYTIDKANKTYTYTGQTFTILNTNKELKAFRLYALLSCLCNLFIILIIGFVSGSKLANQMIFILPFVVHFFPITFIISDVYYMYKFSKRLTVEQYNKSYKQFKNSINTLLVLNVLLLIVIAFLMITSNSLLLIIRIAVLHLILFVTNIFMLLRTKKIKFYRCNETFTSKY